MCFVLILGATKCFLLAVMSYDHYVVICYPLNYSSLMNHKVCTQLVTGSWISGIPVQIGQTFQIFFFCDIPPILNLACGEIFVNKMMVYILAVLFVLVPFLLILISYSKIISTVLKLSSTTSRAKISSTCSSHLAVVALFFGPGIIIYLRPKSSHSLDTEKVLSLFYTIVTPMLNCMIYSLRNKDMIMALKKLLYK
jgi:olfactory receptor